MKKLEHKTYDSKKEMDILDALEEVRHLKKQRQKKIYFLFGQPRPICLFNFQISVQFHNPMTTHSNGN